MSYASYDIECPYCDEKQDIDHDDGYGYEENNPYEQECRNCEKTFIYYTNIMYSYNAEKAPCKNGGEHNWVEIHGYPSGWFSNKRRCSYCEEEKLEDKNLKYDVGEDKWLATNNQ